MWSGGACLFLGAIVLLSAVNLAADDCECTDYSYAEDLFPHDPISISGDAGFTADQGVVSGSGTEFDPYIIEGWDINASEEIGIHIAYTSAHVVIRDVFVHHGHARISHPGISMDDNDGILLESVTNVRVEDVSVTICVNGIQVYKVAGVEIAGSEIWGCPFTGVFVRESVNVTVEENTICDIAGSGIRTSMSSEIAVEGNLIDGCAAGVYIGDDQGDVQVEGNRIVFNGVGLMGDNCRQVHIEGNELAYNEMAAIIMSESAFTNITGNLIENNGCGVHLLGCWDCTVFGNDFASNDMQAFEFRGERNKWHDEGQKAGNHWSDHDGTLARQITTDIEDRYPISEEIWEGDRVKAPEEPTEGPWTESYQGDFRTRTVDSRTSYIDESSMEMILGPDGDLHAVYRMNGTIRYARCSDGHWNSAVLDIDRSTISNPAMMIDDEGNLHVAYLSKFSLSDEEVQLLHVTNEGGAFRIFPLLEIEIDTRWDRAYVDFGPDGHLFAAYETNQVVPPDDPTVSHIVSYTYGISYAHNREGNWITDIVFNGTEASPSDLTMEVDAMGEIHLAFYSRLNDTVTVNYTTDAGGSWPVEKVFQFNPLWGAPGNICIDLDSSNRPHIVFNNRSYAIWPDEVDNVNTMHYATQNSSGWSVSTISSSFRVGQPVDFALDTEDKAHLLYNDQYNYDPMYATNSDANGSSWSIDRLATVGMGGFTGALVVDDIGVVHLLYMSVQENSLSGLSGGGWCEVIYATSEEPAAASGDWLDGRYVVLACLVAAVLTITYAYRRLMK